MRFGAVILMFCSNGAKRLLAVSQNMKRVALTGNALHITTESPVYRCAKPFYFMMELAMCLKFLYFLYSNSSACERVLSVSIGMTTAQVTIPVIPPANKILGILRYCFYPSPLRMPRMYS